MSLFSVMQLWASHSKTPSLGTQKKGGVVGLAVIPNLNLALGLLPWTEVTANPIFEALSSACGAGKYHANVCCSSTSVIVSSLLFGPCQQSNEQDAHSLAVVGGVSLVGRWGGVSMQDSRVHYTMGL